MTYELNATRKAIELPTFEQPLSVARFYTLTVLWQNQVRMSPRFG